MSPSLARFVDEVPDRLQHDIQTVGDFTASLPSRLNHDIETVSTFASEAPERIVESLGSVLNAPDSDPDDEPGTDDAGSQDPDEGAGSEDDDLTGDQDTGDADNETDDGDVTDPDGILDDQETGDADNDTVDGDVTDPEDILDDQETGNPGSPVTEPESNPVIGGIVVSGDAASDGFVTLAERNETITVSFDVDGLAEGASVDASMVIDGQTYSVDQNGRNFSATVPVSSLIEGEIDGSVFVSVTDANGAVTSRQAQFDSGITVDFTEPTESSDPEFGEVTITGDAAEDGTIMFDETSDTVQLNVSVSGIAEGASAEVTFFIDGQSYTANEIDGKWVADVSVMNLSNGTVSGAVAIKVTDADGTVKTETSSFNTDVVVDLTEPVVNSNPVVDAVTVGGEILADGTLTSDELNESFAVQVDVSGIEGGASVEVSVEVDGNVYQASGANGVFIAQVPASELTDGAASGKATVLVTDANGATSQATSTFSTTIETDFSNPDDGVFGPEVQSTGEVEMDLDSMTSYTTGKGLMGVESDFNIEFDFLPMAGGTTPELKASLIQMGEYISSVIKGNLSNFGAIDDVKITVVDAARDGEGGVHAAGSVSGVRGAGEDAGIGYNGSIFVDIDDIESMMNEGVFNDTILHELLHALGFGDGDRWESLLDESQEYGGSFRFTGEAAIAAYNAQHPDIASQDDFSNFGVPVESDFGRGNARSHWDRATFDKTEGGLVAAGTSEFYYGGIDAMTLAAFEDMGYETTWDASNPGAQPGDYDVLPAAVQIPDLVNDVQMAAAEDLSMADITPLASEVDTQGPTIDGADQDDNNFLSNLLGRVADTVQDSSEFVSNVADDLFGPDESGLDNALGLERVGEQGDSVLLGSTSPTPAEVAFFSADFFTPVFDLNDEIAA
ncbi:DUF2457 domain-containing protein [Pseudosulfitobacter sp. DSM 107133]|uniref:DUF2457 domain-containing protein n=1 Tax=Pseudosulfitobacter sp. DSM 107133 TaxID=2883100 RepID=UPI0013B475CB|nr:DUF2457 domain-containing protein [Pseudosulfitobacter sp. DSM 107133]